MFNLPQGNPPQGNPTKGNPTNPTSVLGDGDNSDNESIKNEATENEISLQIESPANFEQEPEQEQEQEKEQEKEPEQEKPLSRHGPLKPLPRLNPGDTPSTLGLISNISERERKKTEIINEPTPKKTEIINEPTPFEIVNNLITECYEMVGNFNNRAHPNLNQMIPFLFTYEYDPFDVSIDVSTLDDNIDLVVEYYDIVESSDSNTDIIFTPDAINYIYTTQDKKINNFNDLKEFIENVKKESKNKGQNPSQSGGKPPLTIFGIVFGCCFGGHKVAAAPSTNPPTSIDDYKKFIKDYKKLLGIQDKLEKVGRTITDIVRENPEIEEEVKKYCNKNFDDVIGKSKLYLPSNEIDNIKGYIAYVVAVMKTIGDKLKKYGAYKKINDSSIPILTISLNIKNKNIVDTVKFNLKKIYKGFRVFISVNNEEEIDVTDNVKKTDDANKSVNFDLIHEIFKELKANENNDDKNIFQDKNIYYEYTITGEEYTITGEGEEEKGIIKEKGIIEEEEGIIDNPFLLHNIISNLVSYS